MTFNTNLPPRSALYLPASNARAIEKARGLAADMIILDLEDAVPDDRKNDARLAAVDAVAVGFGERLMAIRMNGTECPHHAADIAAIRGSAAVRLLTSPVNTTAAAGAPPMTEAKEPSTASTVMFELSALEKTTNAPPW